MAEKKSEDPAEPVGELLEAVPSVPAVLVGINKAIEYLAEHGIAKGKQNRDQGYAYRGIDDVYNALASVLVRAGLVIIPNVLERTVTEGKTRSGGRMGYVLLKVEYTVTSIHDGSHVTIVVYGEGMDMSDKGTNKALSAAYKYACLQLFCIPVDGAADADAETPEMEPVGVSVPRDVKAATAGKPSGSKAASGKSASGKSPGGKAATGPAVTMEQLATIVLAAEDEASDDVALSALARDLYGWVVAGRLAVDKGGEVARIISARRAVMVDEASLGMLKKMLEAFESAGMLSAGERTVYLRDAASRLNVEVPGE